jgi:hypothetical protein
MPTKGNPRHAFRFEPGLWAAFREAAKRDPEGRPVSVIVRDFIAWYARERRGLLVRPPRRDPGK